MFLCPFAIFIGECVSVILCCGEPEPTIGSGTNIGAGTVTCNYDGKQKHQTIVGDDVKIGSDTMLVAPVSVGDGAVTAAGSVVTENVPDDTLVAGVPAKVKKKLKNDAR